MGNFSFDIPDDFDVTDVGDAGDLDVANTVEIPDDFDLSGDVEVPDELEPVPLADEPVVGAVETPAGEEPLGGDDFTSSEMEALETELADVSLKNWET